MNPTAKGKIVKGAVHTRRFGTRLRLATTANKKSPRSAACEIRVEPDGCAVEAGILPAVEPGISARRRKTPLVAKARNCSELCLCSWPSPGGRMPPYTSGKDA
jgi:hypothetical protein